MRHSRCLLAAVDRGDEARIAQRLRISRTAVIKAVNSDAPPRCERSPRLTSFTVFEPRVRALLEEVPDMPATVLAERVGWTGSIRWFSDNVKRLRPEPGRLIRRPARLGGRRCCSVRLVVPAAQDTELSRSEHDSYCAASKVGTRSRAEAPWFGRAPIARTCVYLPAMGPFALLEAAASASETMDEAREFIRGGQMTDIFGTDGRRPPQLRDRARSTSRAQQ